MSQILKSFMGPLKAFRKLNGHLLVPVKFAIPAEQPWPEQFHNKKLGRAVQAIRKEIKENKLSAVEMDELSKINFIPDVGQFESQRALWAFQEFRRLKGHCDLPQNYVIPETEEWPKVLHGLKLGSYLSRLRHDSKLHEIIREAVSALGFDLVATKRNGYDFPRTFSALSSYKAIHGDVNIVKDFVVPHGDARYPENTWGMKLGQNLLCIRYQGTWSEHRAQLEALGVNYELINKHHGFEVIYSALESYQAIHGDVNTVRDFVVPHGDARYPENTWGMKLGINLINIRCQGVWSEHRAELEALGVNYEPINKHHGFDAIFSALESYKSIYGDVNIAQDYVVPTGDARYPENTWGMKLGASVRNIRCNGAWSEHRAQLEALGVNFEVKIHKKEGL